MKIEIKYPLGSTYKVKNIEKLAEYISVECQECDDGEISTNTGKTIECPFCKGGSFLAKVYEHTLIDEGKGDYLCYGLAVNDEQVLGNLTYEQVHELIGDP